MRIYYDTCVIGNSLNSRHADHAACKFVLAHDNIRWIVIISSEISVSENPSVSSAIDALILEAGLYGFALIDVRLTEAKGALKAHQRHKKSLAQIGFAGMDWNHLGSAVWSNAERIFSTDNDFFDPANKSRRGRGGGTRVADYIHRNFGILVTRPHDLGSQQDPQDPGP